METLLRVLSEDEKTQVHERSLKILAETGVKVNTAKGRQYLKDAGAEVYENSKIVKFPRAMVEESLRLAHNPDKPEPKRSWACPGNSKSQIPNSKRRGVLRTNFKRLRRVAHSSFFNIEKLGKIFWSVNALY